MINPARVWVLLVGAVVIGTIAVAIWVLPKRFGRYSGNENVGYDLDAAHPAGSVRTSPEVTVSPSQASADTSPSVSPSTSLAASPAPQAGSTESLTLDPGYVGKLNLVIPVAGVGSEQLLDTFKDARSEGRVHDAIDIPAAAGTPVIATADGEIIRLFQTERGGTTIYQLSADKKLVFYYAHLQGYADGLSVGKYVRRGEVIAYVGDTGNAGTGNYHLHFSIMVTADPKRYWEGSNVNPYPLLRRGPVGGLPLSVR